MGSCTSILRCLMILFNSIFLICGIAGLAAGIWMVNSPEENFNYVKYTFDGSEAAIRSSANITIAVSVFIMFISALGCFGAWCRNRICLGLYAVLQCIVLVMDIAVISLAVTFAKKFESSMKGPAAIDLKKWYNDTTEPDFTKAVDELQRKLKCCGVRNSKDFVRVPESCIGHEDKGCYEVIKNWVDKNKAMLIGIAVAVMLLEIALLVMSILLCNDYASEDNSYN